MCLLYAMLLGAIAPSPSVSVLLASAAVIPLAVAILLSAPLEALTRLVPVPAELNDTMPCVIAACNCDIPRSKAQANASSCH
jgi:hypothetical protein